MTDANLYSLDRMIRIAIDVSAEKDFDRLMKKILLEAMDICHCDAGTVYIKDDGFLHFHTVFTKSKGTSISDQNSSIGIPPVPLKRTHVCACAAIDNKKINIPDIYNSTEYDFTGAQKYDAMNGYRTGSMLVIPMSNEKNKVTGVLQLINSLDQDGNIIPFAPEYEEVVSALTSLASVILNNHTLTMEVKNLLNSFVQVMVDAIEERSAYNATHTRSMVRYAERFLNWLDETESPDRMTEEHKEAFLMSVWLHDIGKLVVPLEILDKPDRLSLRKDVIKNRIDTGCLMERLRAYEEPDKKDEHDRKREQMEEAWKLIESANNAVFLDDEKIAVLKKTAENTCLDAEGKEIPLLNEEELTAITVQKGTLTSGERKLIEKHVSFTADMLRKMHFKGEYEKVPFWSGSHHELLDGSGYPWGLTEKELPFESRLLTIIDIYDALTAEDRPYKPPMPPEKAFSVLESMGDEGKIDKKLLGRFKESGAWRKKH
ncbi:MAG: GAF domain-containing protein [Lachnospiraceae bacterium]|nr:GAF domain-containing protein [Lachnospiraceae bacterium]